MTRPLFAVAGLALVVALAFVTNPSADRHRNAIKAAVAERSPVAGALGIGALAGGILLWKWHGRSRRDGSRHAVRRMPYGNIKRLRISPVWRA